MISGTVNDREARFALTLRNHDGRQQQIEAVIDTGHTSTMSLPPAVIAGLDLAWQGTGRGILADGSVCLFDVYEAAVVWDGVLRRLLVDEADTDHLVGMAMLSGYRLTMDVRPSGNVEIVSLQG
jgi:predicted aspartyl protease